MCRPRAAPGGTRSHASFYTIAASSTSTNTTQFVAGRATAGGTWSSSPQAAYAANATNASAANASYAANAAYASYAANASHATNAAASTSTTATQFVAGRAKVSDVLP